MGMFDDAIGKLGGMGVDVNGLAAKVGLTPEQVQTALAAFARFAGQPGDTADQAAGATGLPADKLHDLLAKVGGEGVLGKAGGMLGGLFGKG